MKTNKRPLWITFLMVVAIGAAGGLTAGGILAEYETHNLIEAIKANDPKDPRDGVFFIWIGITVSGLIIGIIGGLIAAIIVVIKKRRIQQKDNHRGQITI